MLTLPGTHREWWLPGRSSSPSCGIISSIVKGSHVAASKRSFLTVQRDNYKFYVLWSMCSHFTPNFISQKVSTKQKKFSLAFYCAYWADPRNCWQIRVQVHQQSSSWSSLSWEKLPMEQVGMTPWTRETSFLKVPFAPQPEVIAAAANWYELVGMEVTTGKGKKQQQKQKGREWDGYLAPGPGRTHDSFLLHLALPPELF